MPPLTLRPGKRNAGSFTRCPGHALLKGAISNTRWRLPTTLGRGDPHQGTSVTGPGGCPVAIAIVGGRFIATRLIDGLLDNDRAGGGLAQQVPQADAADDGRRHPGTVITIPGRRGLMGVMVVVTPVTSGWPGWVRGGGKRGEQQGHGQGRRVSDSSVHGASRVDSYRSQALVRRPHGLILYRENVHESGRKASK